MAIRVYLKKNNSIKRKMVNHFSYISLILGMMLLFWSFYPVVSFEIYSRFFMQNQTTSPLSSDQLENKNKGNSGSVMGDFDAYTNNLRDFTQAHLWFPTKNQNQKETNFSVKEYYISIPKLNITKALVVVGGEDLSKSLVHYLPRTMPGEYGNVAIFGHSTLPQLYNEKDYKTIFTYLPSLEKGDRFFVHLGDLQYEYEITDMYVVTPDKISVLDQRYDASYITLITCVPPGTYWKRLVVKSKLVFLP